MAFLGLDQSVVTVVSHADTVCVFDDNIHGDERTDSAEERSKDKP